MFNNIVLTLRDSIIKQVFQKRFNGRESFHRNFKYYENGFGYVNAEHWLGNIATYFFALFRQYLVLFDTRILRLKVANMLCNLQTK